jgi:hypothetical protein
LLPTSELLANSPFLISVPPGFIAAVIFIVFLPKHFPAIKSSNSEAQAKTFYVSAKSIAERIDFLGALFLLGATAFLVSAFENASLRIPWQRPLVDVMLVLSGVLWVAFLAWEWFVTRKDSMREPVFPWRLLESRISLGLFL